MIFDRKAPQTRRDAIDLPEEAFLLKYANTTASEDTLKSVYASFKKDRDLLDQVEKNVDQSTDLVPVDTTVTDDGTQVDTSKGPNGQTIVETTNLKDKKPTGKKAKEIAEASEANNEGDVKETKAGRTPRMRELIKEGKDKPQAKKILEDEGFDVSGSGFHSEWNRVSKQVGGNKIK